MGKLDIRKDLENRKYRPTKRIFYWFYRFVMDIKAKKYNAEFEIIDDINKEKGSCFVIFNHLSRIDHYYVTKICYPKKLNMLAGYCEFYRSHLHFAFKHNNVIPKKNYDNTDKLWLKAMFQVIKKGGSITFAPEGLATNDGMNKPIVPKTGGLLKKLKIPVYFVKLEGEYLQNTKHNLELRSGRTKATLMKLFSVEDLETLSVDEIDDKINLAFKHDEYAWQKEHRVKWTGMERSCERLEEILYKCPKCGAEFKSEGSGNQFVCKNCGNHLILDEYYDLHKVTDDSKMLDTVSEWCLWQRKCIIDEIRKDENYEFKERVKIGRLPNDHYLKDLKTSEIVGEGELTINHDGFHYVDDKKIELNFSLTWKELYTFITEVDSSYMNIFVRGQYTDIFPTRKSAIKIGTLIEEMHRLHVNYYKNFPWFDYLYK